MRIHLPADVLLIQEIVQTNPINFKLSRAIKRKVIILLNKQFGEQLDKVKKLRPTTTFEVCRQCFPRTTLAPFVRISVYTASSQKQLMHLIDS